MRISIVNYLKEFLKDKPETKLMNIVKGLHALGVPQIPSSYMTIFLALRENEAFFEKTKPGYYRLRDIKETEDILQSKITTEEIKELIQNILHENANQTAAQIWRAIQKHGVYVSYKSIASILQNIDFNKKIGVVSEKTLKNKYTNNI